MGSRLRNRTARVSKRTPWHCRADTDFHAVSQFKDHGLEMAELLLTSGADLAIRVKLPGHYDRPEEFVECTLLRYAQLFPGAEFPGSNEGTVGLLTAKEGVE